MCVEVRRKNDDDNGDDGDGPNLPIVFFLLIERRKTARMKNRLNFLFDSLNRKKEFLFLLSLALSFILHVEKVFGQCQCLLLINLE